MINVAIIGAAGRMGKEISKAINIKNDCYNIHAAIFKDGDINLIKGADVVIDFSTPTSTLITIDACLRHNIPLVIGTTGFNPKEKDLISKASSIIPILFSANTSLSVNLLFKLTEIATNFETEIIEAHHRYKKDAPSGTALKLGEVVASARNIDFDTYAKFSRHGIDEHRDPNDIGFSVIRGGDIVGKHDVMFIDNGEVLTLTSEINNRASFANGALLAGVFIIDKAPGLYNMFDLLDL